MDPLSTYQLQDVLDHIVEGDWRPRLEMSASGHGINSYVHSYILVVRGLAIAAQVGFGGMREEGEASQEWDRVMQDVSDLLDTYDLCQPHNSDDLVFVAVSDVRGIHHVGLLKHGDTVEVRRSAITAAADPFSDARALIRSHTATGG